MKKSAFERVQRSYAKVMRMFGEEKDGGFAVEYTDPDELDAFIFHLMTLKHEVLASGEPFRVRFQAKFSEDGEDRVIRVNNFIE